VTDCIHQIIKTFPEREHSNLLSVTRMFYVYQVWHSVGCCVTDGSCSSSLERKLMDSINGLSYYLNKCQTLSNTSQMTFFLSGRQRIGAHALCVQHNRTAAALSTSFLLNHARSWMHWLQGLGSHTAAWVMSQKDWRNQGATSWILAMHWYSCEWKMWFLCFPVLPGSAEAQVIWGGIVKCLLIAYFIGNISDKKISKCVLSKL